MKKVMLITPPYHSGVVESAGTWLNLGFVYLAGSLRNAGYDVEIYDVMSYFHTFDQIVERIQSRKPHVVATTAITASLPACLEICRLAKQIDPGIVTVLGNVHPTFMWEEILRDRGNSVDYIVRGEGEITLPEILDCHFSQGDPSQVPGIAYRAEDAVVATSQRGMHPNLDVLPAAWDLIDWKVYSYRPKANSVLGIASSSRGCNQQCSFCSQQLFWKRTWRARSPENFVSEIERLHTTYGVNVLMMPDETPTLDRARWERILDLLIERRMGIELLMETRVEDILRDRDILWRYREAGIAHIYVGVESTNQETLDRFKKDLKVEQSKRAIDLINEHGMISETSFVLGMPEETRESISATVELAKHYNPDMAFFLAIAPWPYANIYQELEPYIATKDYSRYNLIEPVVKPVNMSIGGLRDDLNKATRSFYMEKFSRLKSMTDFKRDYMTAVMKLLMEHSCIGSQIKSIHASLPADMKRFIEKFAEAFSPIP